MVEKNIASLKKNQDGTEKDLELILCDGVEGQCVYLNDHRIAGPKPWGGGQVIGRWTVRLKDLKDAINNV